MPMSTQVKAGRVRSAYRFIKAHQRHHPDQFEHAEQRRQAMAVLQDINSARDYVLTHCANFVWPPPRWTRAMCVAACAQYAHAWPLDPRD